VVAATVVYYTCRSSPTRRAGRRRHALRREAYNIELNEEYIQNRCEVYIYSRCEVYIYSRFG
jgi:hypothetical protein